MEGNLKARAYKDIYTIVFPTWQQQLGEGPHMGVMVRYPHVFSNIVYMLFYKWLILVLRL